MAFLRVKTSRHCCREVKVEDRFEEYDHRVGDVKVVFNRVINNYDCG